MKKKGNFLIRYLKYIFWRNYMWQARTWNERSQPAFTALCTVSFLVFINFLVLLELLDILTGLPLYKTFGHEGVLIATAVLLIIPYFYFIQNGRYKKVLKEYSSFKETNFQKVWRATAIVFHFIACFIAMTALAMIGHYFQGGV